LAGDNFFYEIIYQRAYSQYASVILTLLKTLFRYMNKISKVLGFFKFGVIWIRVNRNKTGSIPRNWNLDTI